MTDAASRTLHRRTYFGDRCDRVRYGECRSRHSIPSDLANLSDLHTGPVKP
jgi:hypothetical protein